MFRAKNLWKLLALLTLFACNLTQEPLTPTLPPTPIPLPPVDESQPVPTQAQEVPVNPDCPATPPGWIPYTVVPGDSLGLLAELTSSSVVDLMTGNCLDNPDQIFAGQVIYVPREPGTAP